MDRGEGISLIVPFRPDDEGRLKTWIWLKRYWSWNLPGAEIVVGRDGGMPFSKTCAVNEAAARATGDVFVVLDADCYMDAGVLEACAEHVRLNRAWWMPYKAMWRLKKHVTRRLLSQDPEAPMQVILPPPDPEDVQGEEHAWVWAYEARTHGAMCQVIPAAGFREVGGMDPRFRGWGGEDSSFAFALDTLWAPRRLNDSVDAAHLWHARIGEGKGPRGRMWVGQEIPRTGTSLRARYEHCSGKPGAMRKLVDEGFRAVG